jgi:hypothetical protein
MLLASSQLLLAGRYIGKMFAGQSSDGASVSQTVCLGAFLRISDDLTIQEALSKFMEPRDGNAVIRHELSQYISAGWENIRLFIPQIPAPVGITFQPWGLLYAILSDSSWVVSLPFSFPFNWI